MSATNRGAVRNRQDAYETPEWCVRALLKNCALPGGRWLEPAVGSGKIVRAVSALRPDVRWSALDIGQARDFKAVVPGAFYGKDYRNLVCPPRGFDVVLTNPPFSQAQEFVLKALQDGRIVVMLLRLNWLGTDRRNLFLRNHPPSIYVLPRRPAFGPNAKHIREGKLDAKDTDATEYAWFVWGLEAVPTVHIIPIGDCEVEDGRK
jgi:hypothetical protein